MFEVKASGLPVWADEKSGALEFRDGLTCESSGSKNAGGLKGLLYNENGIDENEHCYDFYRDVAFERDRELYRKYDFRYDITTIMPGTVGGEYKKTSGHYHGYIEGQTYTYPEVYEVISGSILYILQKCKNFDKEEQPQIEWVKAVRVNAGEAIIIPPFCAHCSINTLDEPSMFSNIAVVSCPMCYAPVKQRHGLSYFAVEDAGKIKYVQNPNYADLPPIAEVRPAQCAELGITFGKPCYAEFVAAPEKYDFLLNPGPYMDKIGKML